MAVCVICLEEGEGIVKPEEMKCSCKVYFHPECYQMYKNTFVKCPYCSKGIPQVAPLEIKYEYHLGIFLLVFGIYVSNCSRDQLMCDYIHKYTNLFATLFGNLAFYASLPLCRAIDQWVNSHEQVVMTMCRIIFYVPLTVGLMMAMTEIFLGPLLEKAS